MAYNEGLFNTISYPAGSDMSGKLFYGVSLVADAATPPGVHVALGGAGKAITGVLQNNPLPGQAACIQTNGTTKIAVTASTAVAAGALLDLDVGGTFIPHAAGTAVAQALEPLASTAAIGIISARLLPNNAAM
jgi:hypothetical protein